MKKVKNLLITIIYLFILNIIFALLIYGNLGVTNGLFYLLESITFAFIINILASLFKLKVCKIITSIALIGITVIYIAQFVHYNFYDCFFSIYSLVNGGQVFGFLPAIIKEIIDNIWGIIILLGLIIIGIVFVIKNEDAYLPRKSLIFMGLLILNLVITIGFVNIFNADDIYSRKNLLFKTNNEVKNVESFGLMTAMTIDLDRFLFSYKEDVIDSKEDIYVFNEDKAGDDASYNVQNINFDNLAKDEKNKKVKQIHTYFKNEEPTNKNEYTGIFKDKNLIFVTAESFNFDVIDKELTPTLYKMNKEGFSFSNFYTPIYYASTSDGEYTNLTGLLPREGTWSYIDSLGKDYPYTYAKVFKSYGYKTHSYHNGIYNFYNRDKVMPNFGFDNYTGCFNGLEKDINCDLWPQSDDEMFTGTFKDYKDDQNFMVYYMSISSHLSHDFKNNDMAKKHQEKVENLSCSEEVKAYISATIDLDKALENLIKNLKQNNLLEDTVIVLVPDHYPYGLSDKQLSEISSLENEYDKYKSGLVIYNSGTKGEEFDKYASNIDVLPTLLNMFGAKYDSRVIIGKDIMSDSKGIIIFNDRSFLTDKGYYNEKANEFIPFKKSVSRDYIENKRMEAFDKTNISSMILETNYYKYLK